MPRSLAGLLFRILTDEANLCIFVLQISPDLNKVKVIWHEKDCVPSAVLIDSIPYFLGEKFAVEVGDIFDSYKLSLEEYKSEFKNSCGSVYSDSPPNL